MDEGRLFPINPSSADGAFERFLSSAIATILTIIFSWRLLLESEDGQQRLSIEDITEDERKRLADLAKQRSEDGDTKQPNGMTTVTGNEVMVKSERSSLNEHPPPAPTSSLDTPDAPYAVTTSSSTADVMSSSNTSRGGIPSASQAPYVVTSSSAGTSSKPSVITPQQLQAQLLKTEDLSRSIVALQQQREEELWLSTETLKGNNNIISF